jgi:hypothetical protein
MTQTDGQITSVQIATDDIASDAALTALGGRVSTNERDIDALQAAYAALTQSDVIIVNGALPSSGQQQNKIYRQPDQDHTPPQFYSDYMWNGSDWVLMAAYNNAIDDVPTAGSDNLVKSGGVFTSNQSLTIKTISVATGTSANPFNTGIEANGTYVLFLRSKELKYTGVIQFSSLKSDGSIEELGLVTDTNTTSFSQWKKYEFTPAKDASKATLYITNVTTAGNIDIIIAKKGSSIESIIEENNCGYNNFQYGIFNLNAGVNLVRLSDFNIVNGKTYNVCILTKDKESAGVVQVTTQKNGTNVELGVITQYNVDFPFGLTQFTATANANGIAVYTSGLSSDTEATMFIVEDNKTIVSLLNSIIASYSSSVENSAYNEKNLCRRSIYGKTSNNVTLNVIDDYSLSFTTEAGSYNGLKIDSIANSSESFFTVRFKVKSNVDDVLNVYVDKVGSGLAVNQNIKLKAGEERVVYVRSNTINTNLLIQMVSVNKKAATYTIRDFVIVKNDENPWFDVAELSAFRNYNTDEFHVAKDGTGHFDEIFLALQYIGIRYGWNRGTNIKKTIVIHDGIYEDEQFMDTSQGNQSKYRTYGHDISFIGTDKNNCLVITNCTKTSFGHTFDIGGQSVIKNLTIVVNNADNLVESDLNRGCYCIHMDENRHIDEGTDYTTCIENVDMYNEVGPCIGAGLRAKQTQKVENCTLQNSASNVIEGEVNCPLYMHGPIYSPWTGARAIIKNNLIVSKDSHMALIMDDTTYQPNAYATIPCEMANNITYSAGEMEVRSNFKEIHLLQPWSKGNSNSNLNY